MTAPRAEGTIRSKVHSHDSNEIRLAVNTADATVSTLMQIIGNSSALEPVLEKNGNVLRQLLTL